MYKPFFWKIISKMHRLRCWRLCFWFPYSKSNTSYKYIKQLGQQKSLSTLKWYFPTHLSPLSVSILKLKKLRSLNLEIRTRDIGAEGSKLLYRIGLIKELRELKLTFDQRTSCHLFNILSGSIHRLKKLTFFSLFLIFDDHAPEINCQNLFTGLEKLTNLNELQLEVKPMGTSDILSFAGLMKNLKELKRFNTRFNLFSTDAEDAFIVFINTLQQMEGLEELSLVVSLGNYLEGKCIEKLARALDDHLGNLHTFYFSVLNYGFDYQTIEFLRRVILKKKKLKKLSLEFPSHFQSDEDKIMVFPQCRIESPLEEFKTSLYSYFGDLIGTFSKLKKISLSINSLQNKHLLTIGDALKNLHELETLLFVFFRSATEGTQTGMASICESLKYLKNLEEINWLFWRVDFDDQCLIKIGKLIGRLAKFQELIFFMQGNPMITFDGINTFLSDITEWKKLKYLKINFWNLEKVNLHDSNWGIIEQVVNKIKATKTVSISTRSILKDY